MRENRTPGSARGALGNWRPYLNRQKRNFRRNHGQRAISKHNRQFRPFAMDRPRSKDLSLSIASHQRSRSDWHAEVQILRGPDKGYAHITDVQRLIGNAPTSRQTAGIE